MVKNAEQAVKANMNAGEAAKYMGVSESLVWKQIRKGILKPARIGDRVVFSRAYLDRVTDPEQDRG